MAWPHPAVFPFGPSLLPFQRGDIKERVITLDAGCQSSLNLFISFRGTLEGFTHGKRRLISSQRRTETRAVAALTTFFHRAALRCNKREGDNALPNPDNCNPLRCHLVSEVFPLSFFFFFLGACFATNSISPSVSCIKLKAESAFIHCCCRRQWPPG